MKPLVVEQCHALSRHQLAWRFILGLAAICPEKPLLEMLSLEEIHDEISDDKEDNRSAQSERIDPQESCIRDQ